MIRELASMTGSSVLIIAIMFLFILVFAVAVWRLWRQDPREAQARGRIPLQDAPPAEPVTEDGADEDTDAR